VKIWLDNQLPSALAAWMGATLGLECTPIRELNLQHDERQRTAAAMGIDLIEL
jgi:predicted nuclease of predicted toxin-antitoxin system